MLGEYVSFVRVRVFLFLVNIKLSWIKAVVLDGLQYCVLLPLLLWCKVRKGSEILSVLSRRETDFGDCLVARRIHHKGSPLSGGMRNSKLPATLLKPFLPMGYGLHKI
jgi:hypothetical protein